MCHMNLINLHCFFDPSDLIVSLAGLREDWIDWVVASSQSMTQMSALLRFFSVYHGLPLRLLLMEHTGTHRQPREGACGCHAPG